MMGSPLLVGKGSKEKAKARGAFATMIISVKKMTCQGSFGEKAFDVSIPEEVRGSKACEGFEYSKTSE